MAEMEHPSIRARIDKIKKLCASADSNLPRFEAASLAQSILHDTTGGGHPLMVELEDALKTANWVRAVAASNSVVTLYEQGALVNQRLAIAHEIEGNLLDIAQAQVNAAETNKDVTQRQVQLAVAAFLVGASLEDALRRLCDVRGLSYDAQRTSIAKLQSVLYQPAKQIEVISSSENKQITAWGDTRNKADHGKFLDLTHSEVLVMVIGVRAFVDKHLP